MGNKKYIDKERTIKCAESMQVSFGALARPLINAIKELVDQQPTVTEKDITKAKFDKLKKEILYASIYIVDGEKFIRTKRALELIGELEEGE